MADPADRDRATSRRRATKELQKNQIKSSPFRSWVAVYHFKTIMENFGDPDNITRAVGDRGDELRDRTSTRSG